jgi:hypothetical protein
MRIDLYVCTYFVYSDIEEGIDEIDSLVVSAVDVDMAEECAVDVIENKYPDQNYSYDIKMIDREIYSKIFLMRLFSQSIENNLN